MRDTYLIIGENRISPQERETLENIDPATGETIGLVPIATHNDIEAAARVAHQGFLQWKQVSPQRRAEVLLKTAEILRSRAAEIGEVLTLEQGKIAAEAAGEATFSAAIFEYYAKESLKFGDEVISGGPANVELKVVNEPVGAVAIFTPWNFPLIEPAAHCAAALAAGCSVVLKVSEETPLSGLALVDALLEAGLPPEAVGLLTGDPAFIAEHLIAAPEIRHVALTGSIPAGRSLASLAGKHLKPVTLELGGDAPVIVCDDVDIQATATLVASRKYRNAGQVCTAPNRIFVHEAIFDDFVESYCKYMADIAVGPGSDGSSGMGPVANERRISAMEAFVAEVRDAGGDIRLGGNRIEGQGFFFQNTVVVEPAPDLAVSTQEIFGPISAIWRFKDDTEVVARANRSNAGLAGYVYAKDAVRAEGIVRKLEVGTAAVNQGAVMFPEAPFGGTKDSGYGRICGPQGIAQYFNAKLIATGK